MTSCVGAAKAECRKILNAEGRVVLDCAAKGRGSRIQLSSHKAVIGHIKRRTYSIQACRAIACLWIVLRMTEDDGIFVTQFPGDYMTFCHQRLTYALPLVCRQNGQWSQRKGGLPADGYFCKKNMSQDDFLLYCDEGQFRNECFAEAECVDQILFVSVTFGSTGKGCLDNPIYCVAVFSLFLSDDQNISPFLLRKHLLRL